MRAGIEHGINIARNESMLTPLADESTEIGAIRVAVPASPSAALLLMLETVIADTPAARRAVEMAVASIVRQHARDRVVILTEDERQHLITGVIETRKAWQSSEQGKDSVTNVVAICPNDHRRAHFSDEASDIRHRLLTLLAEIGREEAA